MLAQCTDRHSAQMGEVFLQTFYSQNFRFNSIHEFKFLETPSKTDCMQYEVWKMFSESFKILTANSKVVDVFTDVEDGVVETIVDS